MIASILFAATALTTLVAAQGGVGVGNQTVDPNTVPLNLRNQWCQQEKNSCNSLCGKAWTTNDCMVDTLMATCVCQDGSKPDLATYINTLPYQVCQYYIGQCVANNATLPEQQNICRSTNTCGTLDPEAVTVTRSNTMMTSTSAGSQSTGPVGSATSSAGGAVSSGASMVSSAVGGATSTSAPNGAAGVQPSSQGVFGVMCVAAAMGLAGFGLML